MPHNDARPHPLQVQEVRTTHRSSPFPVIFPAQHKVYVISIFLSELSLTVYLFVVGMDLPT
jgi:hypothetical protein